MDYITEIDKLTEEIAQALGEYIRCVKKEVELLRDDPKSDNLPFTSLVADRAVKRCAHLIEKREEYRRLHKDEKRNSDPDWVKKDMNAQHREDYLHDKRMENEK